VRTDLNSPEDELADVQTLLHHLKLAPLKSPSTDIQDGLGFVNCAALRVVSVEIGNKQEKEEEKEKERTKEIIKDFASRILDIYHRDHEAVLKHNTTLLTYIRDMVIGIRVQPVGAWRTFLETVTLQNGSHIYLWREPLFPVYLARQTVQADDGTVVWCTNWRVDFPVFDTVLLARLVPLVERKNVIDVVAFNGWYDVWPKDESQFEAIATFLAERQAVYWQKQNPNDPKAQSDHWIKDEGWIAKTKTPLELLRLFRNATVPHDASVEGDAIKRGGHLFVAYFGKGNRAKATQFIKDAQTYIV